MSTRRKDGGLSGIMGTGSTLRRRIVAVQLAAALLPLALAGFGSWLVFGKLLEQKSSELLQTVVHSHAKAIEANLEEQVHLLQLAAATHSLNEISSPARLRRVLDNLNSTSNEGFVDLGVFNLAGDHIAYIGPYNLQGLNYRDKEWFREVTDSGACVSDVFMGNRQAPHCIVAVKQSVENGDGWILRATINSDQFDRLVQSSNLGEGGDVYIVNREGLYQSTPRTGSLLSRAPGPLVAVHPGVREVRLQVAGSDRIMVTTWINNNRWLLVAQQQLAAVKAPVNKAIAEGALVVAASILLLMATTFFATRHLTARIDRANAEREKANQAFIRSAKLASIGELATGLAHEINNPLAIISAEQTNIADVLEQARSGPADYALALDSVRRCQNQVRRCATITQKLLQFGRSKDSHVEPTRLAPRLREIKALMERQARLRDISINLHVEDKLPPVMADPIEMEQVFVNLITNAFDAMPGGGEVTIRADLDGDKVLLEVADSGTGIPPEDLDRVFEPFFTTKPAGRGTGLGLTVCYGIVRSWGGAIRVDSEFGKGTTIDLWIPVDPTDVTVRGRRGT